MTTVIIAIVSAAAAAGITWFVMRSVHKGELDLARKEAETLKEVHRKEMENSERLSQQAQTNYEKALKEMKETVVASMTAETERLLKKREKERKFRCCFSSDRCRD